jgi:pyrroloquinoline quinone (PQQ) biosynthesis protein C
MQSRLADARRLFLFRRRVFMIAVTKPGSDIDEFERAVSSIVDNHPIVGHNAYTSWFSRGEATLEELRGFTVQFSVFSHLFIEAQLRKCINAPDLQSYRAGKEILMNELGVVFTPSGTIEGGTFHFMAGHFEWLAHFAEALGLEWTEIGKRAHGRPSTLAFCDALMEWYSAQDESTAAGASYAIEHWAAAGFWKELIVGLRIVQSARIPDLPLGFWTWHDALEEKHAAHTSDELREAFAKPGFSSERFLRAAEAMLHAVAGFWNGLDAQRRY